MEDIPLKIASVRQRHHTYDIGFIEGQTTKAVSSDANMTDEDSSSNQREVEMKPLTIHDEDQENGHFQANARLPSDGTTIAKPVGWRQTIEDFLFPPHLPRSCQLLRPENIAVPLCYLLVGLLQGLSSPLINVFPLDLGATEAQQTTLSSIRSLPASFKLLFGFLSDNLPIYGYRRKPYMFLGWFLSSFSLFWLLTTTNLDIPSRNAGCFKSKSEGVESTEEDSLSRLPPDAPSVAFLSVCLLGFGTGFWLAGTIKLCP